MFADRNEIAEKEVRIRRLIEEHNLAAVALSTNANFAWVTCGGNNYVGIASEIGVATAVVTKQRKYIVCDNIEAQRLADEEVADQGFEFKTCLWYEAQKEHLVRQLAGEGKLGADTILADSINLSRELDCCRRSLTDAEISRYEILGQQVSECLLQTAETVEAGMTENRAAGILDGHLRSRGIVPIVTLVASDERAHRYRHPLPTAKPIDRYVMLVTGARKWGLVVSATRIVCFGGVPTDLRLKHDAVVRVDAEMIAATTVGTPMNEILRKGIQAYAEVGFPEEWALHHQGGPTGYKSRDFRVTLETAECVAENQAFAWNPSISGTKSEDTIIATSYGPKIISLNTEWPTLEVTVGGKTIPRPDIFVK